MLDSYRYVTAYTTEEIDIWTETQTNNLTHLKKIDFILHVNHTRLYEVMEKQ